MDMIKSLAGQTETDRCNWMREFADSKENLSGKGKEGRSWWADDFRS